MKIYYDEEVDAAFLKLSEEPPTGVVEVSEGVNLDLTDKPPGLALISTTSICGYLRLRRWKNLET